MNFFKRTGILILSLFIFQATNVLSSDINFSLDLAISEEKDPLSDLLYEALKEFYVFNESFMKFLNQEELMHYNREVEKVTLKLRLSKKRKFVEKLNSLLKFTRGKINEKREILSISDKRIESLLKHEKNIRKLLDDFEEKKKAKKAKANAKSKFFTSWKEHVDSVK